MHKRYLASKHYPLSLCLDHSSSLVFGSIAPHYLILFGILVFGTFCFFSLSTYLFFIFFLSFSFFSLSFFFLEGNLSRKLRASGRPVGGGAKAGELPRRVGCDRRRAQVTGRATVHGPHVVSRPRAADPGEATQRSAAPVSGLSMTRADQDHPLST